LKTDLSALVKMDSGRRDARFCVLEDKAQTQCGVTTKEWAFYRCIIPLPYRLYNAANVSWRICSRGDNTYQDMRESCETPAICMLVEEQKLRLDIAVQEGNDMIY